jgi:hypothetical protein
MGIGPPQLRQVFVGAGILILADKEAISAKRYAKGVLKGK